MGADIGYYRPHLHVRNASIRNHDDYDTGITIVVMVSGILLRPVGPHQGLKQGFMFRYQGRDEYQSYLETQVSWFKCKGLKLVEGKVI